MSRFVPRIIPFYLLLLAAGGTANAQSTFEQKAANHFENSNDGLPDLGMAPEHHDGEKHFAEIVKDFGETSMNDNGLDTGEQAKAFALGKVRDALSQQVNQHVESWLSPWGNASVDVKVDNEGHFTGSRGSWFVPLQDNDRYLTWSQLGLTQQDDGLVSNVGVGQRWARGSWLVGYNTFYDNLLDENLQRAGFGAEAWGEYLRLSANFYQPFAAWHEQTATQEQRMAKIEKGPNWEDDLGGEFDKLAKDKNFDNIQKAMYSQFENTFMMYLPRLCEHCLNPACVATCPSGAIYKREEDGIVLIDQDKCRGWRMCITGCPYKKIYFNWKSGKSEKCIFCYPRIEAGQPTICSETCVGRIRYLGVLLYDADAIERAASTENEKDLYQRQLDVFLDPNDPKVIEQAIKDGIPLSVIEAAQQSPVYKMAMEWKLALPLHPEYRTLPMVWYVPPLSPIQSAADAGELGSNGILPDVESLRIPVQYLANLLTAGDTKPVLRALKRMLAMRHYKRAETVDGKVDTRALEEVGLTEAQAQEMYRYLAIANYEDRFVVPSSHRELAREAFPEKNGCGFTFGDGCHGSDTKFNLFNSRRIDAIDVTSKTEPHP